MLCVRVHQLKAKRSYFSSGAPYFTSLRPEIAVFYLKYILLKAKDW